MQKKLKLDLCSAFIYDGEKIDRGAFDNWMHHYVDLGYRILVSMTPVKGIIHARAYQILPRNGRRHRPGPEASA